MPDHKLRMGGSEKRPGSFRGLLSVIPSGQPASFTATRRFADGTLPSFKSLGASHAWPGQVAYSDAAYKMLQAKWKAKIK